MVGMFPSQGAARGAAARLMQRAPIPSSRVLVVDDHPFSLELLAQTLLPEGYEVIQAASAEEGWKYVVSGHARLVVTDWDMPGMSGLELCQTIRKAELPHYVYIVLVTGRDRGDDIVQGLLGGADDFISKPFDPMELAVRVRAGMRILGLEQRLLAQIEILREAASILRAQTCIYSCQGRQADQPGMGGASTPASSHNPEMDELRLRRLLEKLEEEFAVVEAIACSPRS